MPGVLAVSQRPHTFKGGRIQIQGEGAVYRTLDTATWDDPSVRGLSHEGKLLFVYLVTNRHTHVSGMYYLPDVLIVHETGLPQRRLDTLWHTLSGARLAYRDTQRDVVWVRSMLRHQGRGEKNAKSAAAHVLTLHKSPLIQDFLREYPHVRAERPDTVWDTLSDTPSEPRPQEQEQEQEKDQEQERKRTSSTDDARKFINLWNENRGTLPAVRVVSEDRIAQAKRCLRASEDWEAWTPAVKAFAADDFNKERRYGMETLARHCGKWLSLGAEDPRAGDETWQKALRAQAQWEKDYGTA